MGLFESSLERINARLGPLDKHHQTPCYSYHPSSEGIQFKHVQCTSTCLIQHLAKFEQIPLTPKNIYVSKVCIENCTLDRFTKAPFLKIDTLRC